MANAPSGGLPPADSHADAADEPLSPALSRLRLRHLQVLDALQRHGSLRQAALELGIKQSATVALIDDLEFAFGVPLVARDHSGTTLTQAAQSIVARAQVAIQEVSMARQLARRGGAIGGRLRLGASPYLISALVPGIVAGLRAGRPELEIDVREGTLDRLVSDLSRGRLDAVLASVDRATALAGEMALETCFLASERMGVVAGRGHALYGCAHASLQEVLAGPWVLPHATSHIRTLVDNAVFDAGAAPITPQVECRGISNLLLIAASAGLLTVAPGHAIRQPHWRGRVTALASGLPFKPAPYAVVSRRYPHPTPEIAALQACAKAVAQELFGVGACHQEHEWSDPRNSFTGDTA